MNPQPEPYIGNLFAALFGCLVIYYTVKAFYQENSINDLFVIGYVAESDKTINNFHITSIETKTDPQQQQLHNDCVEALRALGMKKSEATKKTKQVFQNNPTLKTVQEFLLIALKK